MARTRALLLQSQASARSNPHLTCPYLACFLHSRHPGKRASDRTHESGRKHRAASHQSVVRSCVRCAWMRREPHDGRDGWTGCFLVDRGTRRCVWDVDCCRSDLLCDTTGSRDSD
eukprot:1356313-Prymnesium_polylepis.4